METFGMIMLYTALVLGFLTAFGGALVFLSMWLTTDDEAQPTH